MRAGIRFYLGQELVDLREFDPQLTVLEWLRRDGTRTGTKEGCAEGDCGACTVLVGKIVNGRLRYRAVNSCIQPLATLDSCHLLTVEDVALPDGTLHPVQQSMVDCHGSQCGFCTPGFVMSLLALYHEPEDLKTWSTADVLAGNLCRCTGYGPILSAASEMLERKGPTDHPFNDDMKQRLSALDDGQSFSIELRGRTLFAPLQLDDLLALRQQYPDATIVSGATDTGLWITKQHRDLGVQIWLGRVEALRTIHELDDRFEIGAGVSYNDSVAPIAQLYTDVGEIWRRIGSVQIRNAGTVGGNIANGSPIGDTSPLLIAIGASLRLASIKGRRELPLEDFFVDYGRQDLASDEIVETVLVPKPRRNWRFRAYKISKRFDQDISAVCGAFNLCIEDGIVTGARIAFGGMAATPKRANETEQVLIGKPWRRDEVEIAMATLARDFTPLSDMRASAEYRLKVARNLLLKCFVETSGAERVRLAGGTPNAT